MKPFENLLFTLNASTAYIRPFAPIMLDYLLSVEMLARSNCYSGLERRINSSNGTYSVASSVNWPPVICLSFLKNSTCLLSLRAFRVTGHDQGRVFEATLFLTHLSFKKYGAPLGTVASVTFKISR